MMILMALVFLLILFIVLSLSFVCFSQTDHSGRFSTQYINPLRKVDKFTVNIMNQDGDGILPNAAGTPNYLIVKFTCLKGNL